jgi:RNA polymerase sigma factor (sigma-70 family)
MVDRLPPRERATLYLRYRADLSFEQIGEVMGITTASARTYASRGVERLRSRVGEMGGDE